MTTLSPILAFLSMMVLWMLQPRPIPMRGRSAFSSTDDTVLNGRLLDGAAIGDQGAINLGRPHDACRQKARMGVDGCSGLVEVKFGIRIAQVEIRLEKRTDCSDVLPISLKNIGLHLVSLDGRGNDILAEIGQVIVETFLENFSLEQVDPIEAW